MRLPPSLYQQAAAANTPVSSTIELLAPCNLKCPHCYVTHAKRSKLTLAVLDDLFAQMADAGTFLVTLTGGEIGLRPDLFEVVSAARTRHFAVKLLSSGTLWSPADLDRIAELGVQSVRVSLYAMDSCTHDAVTMTPGSFAKTKAAIEGLLARDVSVQIACPVMTTNAKQAPEVLAYATALGTTAFFDANITATDRNDLGPKALVASFDELVSFYSSDLIRKHLSPYPDEACPPSADYKPCSVGDYSTYIDCSGDVLPCVNWPESAGNILRERFLSIWRDSPVLHRARALTTRSLSGCSGCGDQPICHPCAGMNLREHGSLETPSRTVCTATAAKAEALGSGTRQLRFKRRLPIVA